MSIGLAGGDAADAHAAILEVADDPQWPKGLLLAAYSGPRLAFETLKLMCPELVTYRGCWFRADQFVAEYADGFLAAEGATVSSTEFVVNHLHVDEMLFGQSEPMPDEIAKAICQMLAFGWRNWARDKYGLPIVTSVVWSDGTGYEVSFRSNLGEASVP